MPGPLKICLHTKYHYVHASSLLHLTASRTSSFPADLHPCLPVSPRVHLRTAHSASLCLLKSGKRGQRGMASHDAESRIQGWESRRGKGIVGNDLVNLLKALRDLDELPQVGPMRGRYQPFYSIRCFYVAMVALYLPDTSPYHFPPIRGSDFSPPFCFSLLPSAPAVLAWPQFLPVTSRDTHVSSGINTYRGCGRRGSY